MTWSVRACRKHAITDWGSLRLRTVLRAALVVVFLAEPALGKSDDAEDVPRAVEVEQRRAAVDAARARLDLARARLESAERERALLEEKKSLLPPLAPGAEAPPGKQLAETNAALSKAEEAKVRAADAVERAEADLEAGVSALAVSQQAYSKKEIEDVSDACEEPGLHHFCLTAGLFVATASAVERTPSPAFKGQTAHRLISLAIPFAGLRFTVHEKVSIDLLLTTSLFSPTLPIVDASDSTACTKQPVAFEQKLPCEGNAKLTPYGAAFLGPSFGGPDITGLGIYFVSGLARTSDDPKANGFVGVAVGTVGVQKVVVH